MLEKTDKQPGIFEVGFAVEACRDGSFVVIQRNNERWSIAEAYPRWAFSNIGDLLAWLTKQAAEAPAADGLGGKSMSFTVLVNDEGASVVTGGADGAE